jgi:hypothetical protein
LQIRNWFATEKIDGMNIRVGLTPEGKVLIGGRTDNAQLPVPLFAYLQETFTPEKMQAAFEKNEDGTWPEVVLFGEGYGEKIQNGGGYRKGVSFRLFDVLVGKWWLEWDSIVSVADGLGVRVAPVFAMGERWFPTCEAELQDVLAGGLSPVSQEEGGGQKEAEGIVARADPMLYDKFGNRMMWKLKFSDFRKGKKRG